MIVRKLPIRAIAPPIPAVADYCDDQVWVLNLDQIESHTGRLHSKQMVARGGVGTSTHAFDAGNVLYSKLRPYLNKVFLPEESGFCTTELVPLRPDPSLVRRDYLAAYLRSPKFLAWVDQQVDGAKMPRVSMKVFWAHEIELPTLDEQKHIAAILDKADSLRRKRQQAIRLADDFLRAVFLDMFGDPEINPKYWPTTRLDEISLQITDGEHQTPQRSNEGVYLLSARNVQDGRLDFGDVDYVPHAEYERIRKRCEPVRGDVLISCSGSIGRVALVDVDVPLTLVRSVALVRPDPTKVRSGFLEYLLRTPSLQRAMQKASKSSAQANLFQAPIRALTAILPPISLQDKFEQIRLQTLKARKKLSESCDEHQACCAAIQNTYF